MSESKDSFLNKARPLVSIITATILIILLIIKAFKVFLLVFAGIMVAVFFRSLARFLSNKTGLPMKASIPISVVGVVAIYVGLGFLLAPKISDQVSRMQKTVPVAAANLEENLSQTEIGQQILQLLPFDLSRKTEQLKSGQNTPRLSDSGSESDSAKKPNGSLNTTLGVLGNIYVVLLLGMFFLANPKPYKTGLVMLFPQHRRDRIATTYDATAITLRSWLFGKMLSMLVVFLLTLIGLSILGVPLFVTLALFAGLVSFIPNFGPLIAIIPAFLIGYLQSPQTGFIVVGLYILVQVIESNIITPVIMKKQIQIPLAVTLFSQLLLGFLVGGWGLVFAVPIVAVVMVIVKMLYVEDTLGDNDVNIKGERLAKEKD